MSSSQNSKKSMDNKSLLRQILPRPAKKVIQNRFTNTLAQAASCIPGGCSGACRG